MNKFKIGDTVKVVDEDQCYSTYDQWAEKHNMKEFLSDVYDNHICNGTVGTVIAHGEHLKDNDYLYGIRTKEGKEYIMSYKGLEKVDNSIKSKLKSGDRLVARNGIVYIVFDNKMVRKVSWNTLDAYNDDLEAECVNLGSQFDIIKVYRPSIIVAMVNFDFEQFPSKNAELLWEREEKSAKQLQLEPLQKQAQKVADVIKKLQDEE